MASKLNGARCAMLALALTAGVASTETVAQSAPAKEQAWNALADDEARRLTSTFSLLLNASRVPLQSLVTLFNGSGRVAAEEFTDTIAGMKRRAPEFFPPAIAFIAQANPSSCDTQKGCWLVAYSTVEDGLLKPGADVSRFAPTAKTVETALAQPDVMKISPTFREADGSQHSFFATTVKNTRQFGVMVSLMDFSEIGKVMTESWLPKGVSLRVTATFASDPGAAPTSIYGAAAAPAGTKRTVPQTVEANGAKFNLFWDFSDAYLGGLR